MRDLHQTKDLDCEQKLLLEYYQLSGTSKESLKRRENNADHLILLN